MDGQRERGSEQVLISEFEHSIDKFFEVSNRISEICGDSEKTVDPEELQRCSSMVTFLKKWKYFNCKPKIVNFAYENDVPGLSKMVIKDIHLSQFSSASIPKVVNGRRIEPVGDKSGFLNCEDYILHAGGSIWSLDWCPKISEISDSQSKCEYLAVAAHPPESPYNRMGRPSTGRGIVQIWCILNSAKERESNSLYKYERMLSQKSFGKKGRGRPCKNPPNAGSLGDSKENTLPSKRRGRPRKQALVIEHPRDLVDGCISPPLKHSRGRPRKNPLPSNETKNSDIDLMLHVCTDVEESFSTEHRDKSRYRPLAIEYPSDKNKQLTQVWHSGRYKKAPARLSNEDIGVMDYEICGPVSTDSKRSDEANSFFDLNMTKETMFLPCYSDLNDVNNSNMVTSFTNTSNHLDKYTNLELSKIASASQRVIENVRTHGENATLKICDKHEGLTVSEYNKSDLQSLPCDSIHEEGQETTFPIDFAGSSYHKDFALPRLVLCLAHMGSFAWDVKWRPCPSNFFEGRCCMGYLAAVLGNGSLEVWDVPSPFKAKTLYNSCGKDGSDPRFLRLSPVFRCSVLKCGGNHSIPLTVEWSPSSSCDLILAGCHDGMVALWKFSADDSSLDTKPLLYFKADSVPIRAIAWAPNESDPESSNLMVTAGHESLKFWDIRDPYCPLWEFSPIQKHILSLDWVRKPRCIVLSFDDGNIRIVSLSKTVSDAFANKNMSGGLKLVHHYYVRSAFPIWSVHVSHVTEGKKVALMLLPPVASKSNGNTYFLVQQPSEFVSVLKNMEGGIALIIKPGVSQEDLLSPFGDNNYGGHVAYCDADGCVRQFQLTAKSIEKDRKRNRTSHYLCGSIVEDDQNICINISLPNVPIKDTVTHRCDRKLLTESTQINTEYPKGSTLAIVPVSDSSKYSDTERVKPETMSRVCSTMQSAALAESKKSKKKFPSKTVALHKVRWNISQASQRWLCYAGAAGIVRCQEICLPDL